jgi:DNA-directed RNA polymerase specialized sigma24 family protein
MEYWKFKAIDKLRDYPLKAAAIQSLQEELQRLELEATNIRSATADATPVQGGGSSREDKLLSNIIHRDEIKRMIAGAKLACNVVNTSLAALDAAERDLLTDMYILSGGTPRIAEMLGLDERSVYRRADRALRRFVIALYGVGET